MRAAALAAANRGLPVFPVGRNKQPLTRNGLLNATTDPAQITAWWTQHPDANIGLRTGLPSGLVVLDVDGQAGADALVDLEQTYQPLPPTTSVTTPSGGQHYYFKHPGHSEIRNSARQVGPGLDIRGDGGYVLMPPSIGANDRPYAWDSEHAPAYLPGWLNALIAQQASNPRQRTPASTWIDMIERGLQNGQRNAGLTRFVGHLLARDVDAVLALTLTRLVNARCKPPLDDKEVVALVESIAGRELRKRTSA